MEAFYEESAICKDTEKKAKGYAVLHILSIIFLILGVIAMVVGLFNFPIPPKEENFTTNADYLNALDGYKGYFMLCVISLALGTLFLLLWFTFWVIKAKINISYDYCFINGELRISRIYNVNKRKLLVVIDCAEILQIGDADNSSFERLKADPTTSFIVCTPNMAPQGDKFFMYVLCNRGGKELYVLECRENMLMNILKFAKRGVLETDYVMQEKKNK